MDASCSVFHILIFLCANHARPRLDEIDGAVALDGDVLCRDHLDGFLCDHASEKGCRVGQLCSRCSSTVEGDEMSRRVSDDVRLTALRWRRRARRAVRRHRLRCFAPFDEGFQWSEVILSRERTRRTGRGAWTFPLDRRPERPLANPVNMAVGESAIHVPNAALS